MKRQKAYMWANEKICINQAPCLGRTILTFLCIFIFEVKSEEKFFRWLIFSKEKLHLPLMIAKQFLFPMLQMISACILLYLASSIFVPAAPSGNFLPWVIIPLKFLETALRCPLSTDLQSESKECVGCAQAQLQRQCQSVPAALHGHVQDI